MVSPNSPEKGTSPAEIDITRPHPARTWDYYLGGKDNSPPTGKWPTRSSPTGLGCASPRGRTGSSLAARSSTWPGKPVSTSSSTLAPGCRPPATCTRSRRLSIRRPAWSTWTTTRSCWCTRGRCHQLARRQVRLHSSGPAGAGEDPQRPRHAGDAGLHPADRADPVGHRPLPAAGGRASADHQDAGGRTAVGQLCGRLPWQYRVRHPGGSGRGGPPHHGQRCAHRAKGLHRFREPGLRRAQPRGARRGAATGMAPEPGRAPRPGAREVGSNAGVARKP